MIKPTVRKKDGQWFLTRISRFGREALPFRTWDAALLASTELRSHYGPTATDSDPGKLWCYDCGHEVYGFEEGDICSGCGRGSEEP